MVVVALKQELYLASMSISNARQTAAVQRELVESLYLCPGVPDQWSAFLERMVQLTDSRSARLLVLDHASSRVESSIKHNIDDSYHQQYVDYHVNTCPWRPELAQLQPGRLYSTFLDFSCKQDAFYQTEFFNDWAKPQDIHHGVCGTVYQTDEQKIQLLVQRTGGQGHFSHRDTGFFNRLLPHLRRVIALQRQLEPVQQHSEALGMARDISPLPFVLLDASGQVVHLSPEAEQTVGHHDKLRVHDNRLELQGGQDLQQRFRKCLDTCLDSAAGCWDQAGGWFRVEGESGTPLHLLVMPVHPDVAYRGFSGTRAFAAVFVHDPAARVRLCPDTLKAIFGITPAESRLLQALVQGESLESYAVARARSLHTVKTQLKSLLRKTGTDRQVTLVSLILQGPAVRRARVSAFTL